MAHLLIIDLPGANDADIVRAAIDDGHEFTFLTSDLDLYRQQSGVKEALAHAREQIEVSPFDQGHVERVILSVHAIHPFDALLCLIDIRMVAAARLAARLGLRHLNPASAELLRDKFSVRRRLAEKGITQPPFALATSTSELKSAVALIDLPLLIKPSDGYGSQNIVALLGPEDLDPLLSPLDEMLPGRTDYGLGVRSNERLLIERFLEGTVVGCDTLTNNGRHHLLGVNEKIFYDAPSFAIRGGCFTPNGPAFKAIQDYVFAVLDAVDFDWGAAHVELMLTSEGPRLIEINPRLVGAKIPRLVSFALNRSLHSDLIALHLGEWDPPVALSNEHRVAVTRWIVADQDGIFDHVELPDWQDERIRCVEILKKAGDPVRPPFENFDRIGYVMVCADARAQAEALAERFISGCHVKLQMPELSFSG